MGPRYLFYSTLLVTNVWGIWSFKTLGLFDLITEEGFHCISEQNYSGVAIRAYEPRKGGQPDKNLITNINNFKKVPKLQSIELLFHPNSSRSSKSGAEQFRELYSHLKMRHVSLKRVWLMVTHPMGNAAAWENNQQSNIDFIKDFLSASLEKGVITGIFTNWYDWLLISDNYRGLSSKTPLWYWNVLGMGSKGETPTNINDFRPFGNWRTNNIFAKQFGLHVNVCGYIAGNSFILDNDN